MNKSDRFDNHTNVLFNTVQKILEEDESIREDLMPNRDLSVESKFSEIDTLSFDSCHNYYSFGLTQYEMQNYSFPKSRIEPKRYSTESWISSAMEDTENLEPSKPLIEEIVGAILAGTTNDHNNISITLESKTLGLIEIEITSVNRGKISEVKFLSSIPKTLDFLEENKDQIVDSMRQILGYDDVSFEFEKLELNEHSSSDECIFEMDVCDEKTDHTFTKKDTEESKKPNFELYDYKKTNDLKTLEALNTFLRKDTEESNAHTSQSDDFQKITFQKILEPLNTFTKKKEVKDLSSQKPLIRQIATGILSGIANDQNNISIFLKPRMLELINIEITHTKRGKISEIKFLSSTTYTSYLLEDNKDELIESMREIIGYDDISFKFAAELSGDSDDCIFYMEC